MSMTKREIVSLILCAFIIAILLSMIIEYHECTVSGGALVRGIFFSECIN